MSLNQQGVLDHALDVLDRYGFADLSMRRLATSLGVQPGALYWHFENKQTLLVAVAEAILADRAAAADERPWQDRVRVWAGGLRAALLRHRDGAEVVASVLAVRPARLDPAGEVAQILTGQGLGTAQATAAGMALLHFVIGHSVDEQGNAAMAEFGVAELVDAAAAQERFDYGLDLMLAGLDSRVGHG